MSENEPNGTALENEFILNFTNRRQLLMFEPEVAEIIGIPAAIMFNLIRHYCNNPTNRNVYDGRKWVFNTFEEWRDHIKVFSIPTIRRAIQTLTERNLILVGNFNKNKMDRTQWYSPATPSDPHDHITSDHHDQGHLITTITCNNEQRDLSKRSIKESKGHSGHLDDFETFWKAYPGKSIKRKRAEVAFKKVIKVISLDFLLAAIKKQESEKKNKLTHKGWAPEWPHAATWLNQARYEDEVMSEEEIRATATRVRLTEHEQAKQRADDAAKREFERSEARMAEIVRRQRASESSEIRKQVESGRSLRDILASMTNPYQPILGT